MRSAMCEKLPAHKKLSALTIIVYCGLFCLLSVVFISLVYYLMGGTGWVRLKACLCLAILVYGCLHQPVGACLSCLFVLV